MESRTDPQTMSTLIGLAVRAMSFFMILVAEAVLYIRSTGQRATQWPGTPDLVLMLCAVAIVLSFFWF